MHGHAAHAGPQLVLIGCTPRLQGITPEYFTNFAQSYSAAPTRRSRPRPRPHDWYIVLLSAAVRIFFKRSAKCAQS